MENDNIKSFSPRDYESGIADLELKLAISNDVKAGQSLVIDAFVKEVEMTRLEVAEFACLGCERVDSEWCENRCKYRKCRTKFLNAEQEWAVCDHCGQDAVRYSDGEIWCFCHYDRQWGE